MLEAGGFSMTDGHGNSADLCLVPRGALTPQRQYKTARHRAVDVSLRIPRGALPPICGATPNLLLLLRRPLRTMLGTSRFPLSPFCQSPLLGPREDDTASPSSERCPHLQLLFATGKGRASSPDSALLAPAPAQSHHQAQVILS